MSTNGLPLASAPEPRVTVAFVDRLDGQETVPVVILSDSTVGRLNERRPGRRQQTPL